MDLEIPFRIANTAVIPFWLLLVVAPSWVWTRRLVHSAVIPLLLGPLYVLLFLCGPAPAEGAGFGSLAAVGLLFRSPFALLAGWIHYLIFDLFIGAWIARDALRRALPRLAVAPCLVLTLMLGPSGLLAYLLLRGGMRRTFTLDEGGAGSH